VSFLEADLTGAVGLALGADIFDGLIRKLEAPVFDPSNPFSNLEKIRKTRRQEERIAIILETILEDRKVGISVLEKYGSDRGKFASAALLHIRNQLASDDGIRDELIVANMISQFYSNIFPFNRGILLYFLAKHLTKYPLINKAIRQCLNRSGSVFLFRYRDDINRLLG
jgi:hypothetical protein